MRITFAEDGWSEYFYWQRQDKKMLKKINTIFEESTVEDKLEEDERI